MIARTGFLDRNDEAVADLNRRFDVEMFPCRQFAEPTRRLAVGKMPKLIRSGIKTLQTDYLHRCAATGLVQSQNYDRTAPVGGENSMVRDIERGTMSCDVR